MLLLVMRIALLSEGGKDFHLYKEFLHTLTSSRAFSTISYPFDNPGIILEGEETIYVTKWIHFGHLWRRFVKEFIAGLINNLIIYICFLMRSMITYILSL